LLSALDTASVAVSLQINASQVVMLSSSSVFPPHPPPASPAPSPPAPLAPPLPPGSSCSHLVIAEAALCLEQLSSPRNIRPLPGVLELGQWQLEETSSPGFYVLQGDATLTEAGRQLPPLDGSGVVVRSDASIISATVDIQLSNSVPFEPLPHLLPGMIAPGLSGGPPPP
jgi:hypothetical protein